MKKTLAEKIEEITHQHEKEVEMDVIESALNERFNCTGKISEHIAYADYRFTAPVEDVTVAIAMAEELGADLLPVFKCKDSCLSFRPETHLGEFADRDPEVVTPYLFIANRVLNYPSTQQVDCFFKYDGWTICLTMVLEKPLIRFDHACRYDQDGTAIRVRDNVSEEWHAHWPNIVKFWSTPDSPGRRVAY